MTKHVEGFIVGTKFSYSHQSDFRDQATGQVRITKRIVTLMTFPDRTIDHLNIGYPDRGEFKLPALTPNTDYGFPVIPAPNKSGPPVRFTIRQDLAPFPLPEGMHGLRVYGEHEDITQLDWKDKDNQLKQFMKFKVLVNYGDGRRLRTEINWPYDGNYTPPSLTRGQLYGYPITPIRAKKDGTLRYIIRQDQEIIEAPEIAA